MYTIIIICLTTLRIIAYENHSKRDEMICTLIDGQKDKLLCKRGTSVEIDKIWMDNITICAFGNSLTTITLRGKLNISCPLKYVCDVTYQRRPGIETFQSLKIRYQCKVIDDSTTPSGELSTEFHGGSSLPGNEFSTDVQDDNNTPIDELSTELQDTHGGSSLPGESFRTDVQGVPMYAFIIGGMVAVVIITCIIVGVIRLRRRNVQRNGRKNIQGKMNPTNDTTQEQEANLMNSPDSVHMPASHAVNLVVSTDASNTYSHLRNTEEDPDVMYDHTVRHNVHMTCDGDYGIAHRRITEDDYDVSGNFRHSFNNKEGPVYN
ncbi:uncharacterized protein LOC134717874 [Mytilus trossulus]|uniref:uncharacterized protein LOC134717874 n=1 Tax=Mytilus trossulus TaxID=6551 RepID=UPI0030066CDD